MKFHWISKAPTSTEEPIKPITIPSAEPELMIALAVLLKCWGTCFDESEYAAP